MPESLPINPIPELRGTLAPEALVERETRLRGSLSPGHEHSEVAEVEESRLRGSLVNDIARVGLIEASDTSEPEPDAVSVNSTFIQRDTGKSYTVQKIGEGHSEVVVTLRSEDGGKVTLGLEDFRKKLASEDGPWHR
ncbi:hypothetical protein KA047_02935 [Candidatus Saccharibacteria bacterium]|nr:hypothetical protein [Candidatus Saccharibacteria bacterium]